MGELLDRDFQRQLLLQLRDNYPRRIDPNRLWGRQTDNRLLVNLSYLAEHGLVEMTTKTMANGEMDMGFARITASGMDFIADDGGLSAILGVVTVKLHEDTIRELLIAKISRSNSPESLKDQLVAKIKALPADALGTLTQKALEAGLESLPNVGDWLSAALPK